MTSISVKSISDLLTDPPRKAEVVYVIRNSEGKVLVVQKFYYMAGIYRFPGGGVKDGEDPVTSLKREVLEEFNRNVTSFKHIKDVKVKLTDKTLSHIFTSHVFEVELDKEVTMEDDQEHAKHKWVDTKGLKKVAEALENHDKTYRTGTERSKNPNWNDWGRFRAVVIRELPI